MDSNIFLLSSPVTLKHTLSSKTLHFHSLLTKPFNIRLHCSKSSSGGGVSFDGSAFEAERLRLDARARQTMAETSRREMEMGQEDDNPKAWKWVIRKRIWDLMEAQNIAQNPRPVHHRIPNFDGAPAAAKNVQLFPLLGFRDFVVCSTGKFADFVGKFPIFFLFRSWVGWRCFVKRIV